MEIKAVLFDFGNTLVRQNKADQVKLEKAGFINLLDYLKKRHLRGITLTKWITAYNKIKSEQEKLITHPLAEMDVLRVFRYLAYEFQIPEDIQPEHLAQLFFLPLCQSRMAFDDVQPVLKILHDRRLTLGIISNTILPGAMMNETLQRLQIREYFSFTIYSSDLGIRKPHPALFQLATTLCGCKPSQIVMVGDELETDILGADSAGMKHILIHREKKMSSVKKNITVAYSLQDILPLIGKK